MKVCISCFKEIGNIQKALEIGDGNGLVYLVCEACQLEAMPDAPIQKGGGEVLVSKARTNRHKPNWVRITVGGHITWGDANI